MGNIIPSGKSKQYTSEINLTKDSFVDIFMKQRYDDIPYVEENLTQESNKSNKIIKEAKIKLPTYNAVHEIDSFLTFSRLEKCNWDIPAILECIENNLHISIDPKVIEKVIRKRRTSPTPEESENGLEKTGDDMEKDSCNTKKSKPIPEKCKNSTPLKDSKSCGKKCKNSKQVDSCYMSQPKEVETCKGKCKKSDKQSNLKKESKNNNDLKLRKIVVSENLIPTMKKEDRTKMKDYWADLLGDEFAEDLIKEY